MVQGASLYALALTNQLFSEGDLNLQDLNIMDCTNTVSLYAAWNIFC